MLSGSGCEGEERSPCSGKKIFPPVTDGSVCFYFPLMICLGFFFSFSFLILQ